MKRIIAYLLALMLPLCAGAESIKDQINAPDTCQNTYQSNSGRTKVEVDASVYVPQVETIPIYAVTVRDFTAEEGWRLARLTEPDQEWQRVDRQEDIAADGLAHFRYGVGGQFDSAEMNLDLPAPYQAYISLYNTYLVGVFNRQPDSRVLKYRWHDPQTHLFFYPAATCGHPETVGQTIGGQLLTVEEATEMADAFMAEMAPEYELRIVFGTEGETGDAKVHEQLAYCFGYTRTVSGVPITYVSHDITVGEFVDTPMAPAPGQELITLVIHNDRVVEFNWQDPCQIGDMLQPSAELLPFEQIMSIFGSVAPLSVQRTEIENRPGTQAANGMEIREIRLGYMPVLCKDNPNQWELRPVWDFIGSKILPYATYDYPCHSLLTIDAVDGTVIDRSYGY